MKNMKTIAEEARARTADLRATRDQCRSTFKPYLDKLANIVSPHVDKGLMIAIVVTEILQAESLDNIEEASNISAAVDYDNYTKG